MLLSEGNNLIQQVGVILHNWNPHLCSFSHANQSPCISHGLGAGSNNQSSSSCPFNEREDVHSDLFFCRLCVFYATK